MSLFDKLNNKRYDLQEKKEKKFPSDSSELKKGKLFSKKDSDAIQSRSVNRDAKKYASGEYPKIGGGDRMTPKSKGPGASTGGTKIPTATVGGKSKGTTPVKVNITKPVKQSEISKQAKKFTKKINKKNINRPEGIIGDTYVSTTKKGKIRSAKKVNPTLKKSISQVKGDIEFKQSLKKSGASGDVSDTAPKKIRDYVSKKREARATKLGTPDPFKSKTKAQTKFDDIFKGAKKTKKFKLGGKTQFDISKTKVGKMELPPKKVSPEVEKKSISDFKKKISDATKQTKQVSKKIGSIKSPKMSSQPLTGFGGAPGSKPTGGTKTVKQSEVSKQAKDFTQKINQKKTTNTAQKMSTVKGDPLQGNVDYDTSTKSTPKPKKPNVFKRVTAATSGKKVTNSKGTGNQFRGPENKVAKNNAIAQRGGSVTGGGKPPKPPVKGGTLGFFDDTPFRKPRKITKTTKALMSGQQKFAKSVVGKGLKKNLPTVYKGLKALKPAGRAFAKTGVIGGVATLGLAATPAVRGFLKKAAAGGIAGGIIGGSAASQKQSDKARIKAKKLPVFKDEILDKKGKQKFPNSKKVARMGLNLSDISKPKKDKARTSQSIATEVDYLKKRQKVAPYGAKYTG